MKQNELRSLLNALHSRDSAAFAALYDMLSKPVYVIAYRITQSREQAEDITQEVFLRLWESPPDDSVKNPRAFIFQSVHNRAVDAVRRAAPAELPDTLPDPGCHEEEILLRTALEQAMQTLTTDERETVALHIHAELPFHEIARMTNRSLPAAYRTYQRALRKLRAELEKGESQ